MSVTWKFPAKNQLFLRIEVLFLTVLSILVFLYTSFQFEQKVFAGLVYTVIFLMLYSLISFGIKRHRKMEESYSVNATHLHITKKDSSGTKKHKIHLKHVVHHKLDKFFLGGYVVTKDGARYSLFFNDEKEMGKFEKHLKKHLRRK